MYEIGDEEESDFRTKGVNEQELTLCATARGRWTERTIRPRPTPGPPPVILLRRCRALRAQKGVVRHDKEAEIRIVNETVVV